MAFFNSFGNPPMTLHASGSGGKAMAKGGNVIIGPYQCCCNAPCGGCLQGAPLGPVGSRMYANASKHVPRGYTVTMAGWQYPTCWGPKLAFSNYWSVGITHEGGDINGTFDVPARHYFRPYNGGPGGEWVCHYVSDPIPFKLQWYIYPDIEEPYDGPNCGIKMEQWHNDYVQIYVNWLFDLEVGVQGGSYSQGSLDPVRHVDQTPGNCSEVV